MYNRIHNDYDNNVVRVELNSSYRPRASRTSSRETNRLTSAVNRSDTFTKDDRPSNIIRSDTFILKHNDESSDEHKYDANPNYSTYTRTKKKNSGTIEKNHDDKSSYNTYTRSEKKGSDRSEKSLYINTDTYRKLDKKHHHLAQESENLNTNTFTKSTKPKRVESLIKRFEKNFWRRNKDPKEASPVPSANSTDSIKRSKNIFSLIAGGNNKKTTRDIGIECKLDDERDYYNGMGTRRSSNQSLLSEKKYRPLKSSQRIENGSNQRLTSIIKPTERRVKARDNVHYENVKKPSAPTAIRVEINTRNSNNKYISNLETHKKPIGIASPLPQARTRPALKTGTIKRYEKKQEVIKPRAQELSSSFKRDDSDQMSFREYRERLRMKKENRRITDTSDDDLRRSYQQSFFIPM